MAYDDGIMLTVNLEDQTQKWELDKSYTSGEIRFKYCNQSNLIFTGGEDGKFYAHTLKGTLVTEKTFNHSITAIQTSYLENKNY